MSVSQRVTPFSWSHGFQGEGFTVGMGFKPQIFGAKIEPRKSGKKVGLRGCYPREI